MQVRRAERVASTRLRIVEAAVELHGTIGPAATTVTAVAGRAGVPRLTVYRHFATDGELFQACSDHFLSLNPPPDPRPWLEIADPAVRARGALADIYAYYRRNRAMLANVFRDAGRVSALEPTLAGYRLFRAAIPEVLAEGWTEEAAARARVLGAAGVAIDFRTWQALDSEGMPPEAAAGLMLGLLRTAAGAG